jgi:hypothetical protein
MKLQGLVDFVTIFADPNFTFAEWSDNPPDEDGITEFPYPAYSAKAIHFGDKAYKLGWVVNFRWSGWAATPAARFLIKNPVLVASASPDNFINLITTCVRSERLMDGALDHAFQSGLLIAIVKRAKAPVGA